MRRPGLRSSTFFFFLFFSYPSPLSHLLNLVPPPLSLPLTHPYCSSSFSLSPTHSLLLLFLFLSLFHSITHVAFPPPLFSTPSLMLLSLLLLSLPLLLSPSLSQMQSLLLLLLLFLFILILIFTWYLLLPT